MAFGNAIGSNVINILAVLGVAALVRPIAASGLRPADVAVFLVSAVLVLPLMARGSVLTRWEGGVAAGRLRRVHRLAHGLMPARGQDCARAPAGAGPSVERSGRRR